MNDLDLVDLIGLRVCHDLINPVGAISLGLEMALSEPKASAESLREVEESARAANAALVFWREALARHGANVDPIGLGKLAEIVHGHLARGKLAVEMPRVGPDLPRPVARTALMMLLCGRSAAPRGGQMVLAAPRLDPLSLTLAVQGRRVGLPPTALALMTGTVHTLPEQPRDAHFVLLPRLAAYLGAKVVAEQGGDEEDGRVTLRVVAA